jgi:hypothetical protein
MHGWNMCVYHCFVRLCGAWFVSNPICTQPSSTLEALRFKWVFSSKRNTNTTHFSSKLKLSRHYSSIHPTIRPSYNEKQDKQRKTTKQTTTPIFHYLYPQVTHNSTFLGVFLNFPFTPTRALTSHWILSRTCSSVLRQPPWRTLFLFFHKLQIEAPKTKTNLHKLACKVFFY